MSNTFDIRRFSFLFKKTIYERRLALIGFFVLLMVLILLIYSQSRTGSSPLQYLSAVIGLVLGPSIIVNILLNNFSKKSEATSYLTLPCSHFEKWLVVFVITVFIYLPLFLALFKVIDTLYIDYYRELSVTKFNYTPKQLEDNLPYLKYSLDDSNNSLPFLNFLSNFFLFGGIALLGSLYFNQKSYIKTALVFLAFAVIGSFFNSIIYKTIIGETVSLNFSDFTNVTVINQDLKKFPLVVSASFSNFIKFITLIFLPVALWIIGLVRFRDKEL